MFLVCHDTAFLLSTRAMTALGWFPNGHRNMIILIYMLSMLYVRLTIKVKMAIPESFKVGWYTHKITGSSHLKALLFFSVF